MRCKALVMDAPTYTQDDQLANDRTFLLWIPLDGCRSTSTFNLRDRIYTFHELHSMCILLKRIPTIARSCLASGCTGDHGWLNYS